MKNSFSVALKESLSFAREDAIRLESDFIGTGHLLLGLIKKTGDGFVALSGSRHSIPELITVIESSIREKKETSQPGTGKMVAKSRARLFRFCAPRPAVLMLDRQAEKAIRQSVTEAKEVNQATVEPEHLIHAILKNREDIVSGLM